MMILVLDLFPIFQAGQPTLLQMYTFVNFSVLGTGYQMATTSGSNVEFKGTIKTTNVNVTIVSNETDPWGSGKPQLDLTLLLTHFLLISMQILMQEVIMF